MPALREYTGRIGAVGEIGIDAIGDEVSGSLAGIHIQAGGAVSVVVIEKQPAALLVGVVERQGAGAGIIRSPRRAD